MTERERLIELLRNAEVEESEAKKMNPFTYSSADFTADYLLANGIVVPPCKVGDTVYEIVYSYINHNIRKIIKKRVVNGIEIGKDGFISLCCGRTAVLFVIDFGKSVFLTREEAEKALNK